MLLTGQACAEIPQALSWQGGQKEKNPDVEGAQSGPTAKNRDGKLDSRLAVKKESPWQTYDEGYNRLYIFHPLSLLHSVWRLGPTH